MLALRLKSAAVDGDIASLENQLRGISPDQIDDEGCTPLHYAAWGGALGLCTILLSRHSVIDPRSYDLQTPLHFAARQGRINTVQFLLQHGANVSAVDKIKYTPLHMAAEANWGVTGWEGSGGKQNQNADVCRVLLDYGADPMALDSFGRTPLDVATTDDEIRTILRQAFQQKKKIISESRRNISTQKPTAYFPTAPNQSNTESLKKPIDWDQNDVAHWLEEMGLPQYAPIFIQKTINGKYLMKKMTQEKLSKIIQDEFHQERIMDEIEELKKEEVSPAEKKRELKDKLKREAEQNERKEDELKREAEENRQKEMKNLKSHTYGGQTQITFENDMDNDVRLCWVDYSGEPQLRKFLGPGEVHTEDTMIGHVWQLIDDKSGQVIRAEIATEQRLWIHATDDFYRLDQDNLPSYSQTFGTEKY